MNDKAIEIMGERVREVARLTSVTFERLLALMQMLCAGNCRRQARIIRYAKQERRRRGRHFARVQFGSPLSASVPYDGGYCAERTARRRVRNDPGMAKIYASVALNERMRWFAGAAYAEARAASVHRNRGGCPVS